MFVSASQPGFSTRAVAVNSNPQTLKCQTPSPWNLYSQSTVTFCHCLTAGAVRVCVIGLWYQVLTVSVVVYWFELVVVINLFHVVVVSLPCWCLWRDSNRRENPLGSFEVFDWVCSSRLSEFGPFRGRSSSMKHSLKRKIKGMDLNYYLSMSSLMTCQMYLCAVFSQLSCFCFFSPGGKKEFTQTDAPSTSTTVRPFFLKLSVSYIRFDH